MSFGPTKTSRPSLSNSVIHPGGYRVKAGAVVAAFDDPDAVVNGVLLAGVPVGRLTATGDVVPHDPEASDGSEKAVGVIAENVPLSGTNSPVSVLIQGVIDTSKAPVEIDERFWSDCPAITALDGSSGINLDDGGQA